MLIMLTKIGNSNNYINEMSDYYHNITEHVKNPLIQLVYLSPLSSWLVLMVLASQRVTTPFLSLMTASVSPSLSQPIPVHIL